MGEVHRDKSFPKRHRERASATMATIATREQVQEALPQPQTRVEGEKAAAALKASGTGCNPNKREGIRVQGAVPSSFATAETNEQLKDDEKSGKQPGNGTTEPKKQKARDRDRDPTAGSQRA